VGNYHEVLICIDKLFKRFEIEASLESLEHWNQMVKYFMDQYRIYHNSDSKVLAFKTFRDTFIGYFYKDEMI
jgi:hypothetical protein